jgi:hypothetical protein
MPQQEGFTMGILERIAGSLIGVVTMILLGVVGTFFFIPDASQYLRMKRM